VADYNHAIGGLDLKHRKLDHHLTEREMRLKWYIKLLKIILNVGVHNVHVVYNSSQGRYII
jgi:hypothetical protein